MNTIVTKLPYRAIEISTPPAAEAKTLPIGAIIAVLLWAVVAFCGTLELMRHAREGANTGRDPIGWPAQSPNPGNANQTTVVL